MYYYVFWNFETFEQNSWTFVLISGPPNLTELLPNYQMQFHSNPWNTCWDILVCTKIAYELNDITIPRNQTKCPLQVLNFTHTLKKSFKKMSVYIVTFFVWQQRVWCICPSDPGEALCAYCPQTIELYGRQYGAVLTTVTWSCGTSDCEPRNSCHCQMVPSSTLFHCWEWSWQNSQHYHSCPFRGLCSLVIS